MRFSISDSRLAAVWLLTLAVVSPAAAGSFEPAYLQATSAASSAQTVRVADKSAVQTDGSAKVAASVRRAPDRRDPRLNSDLAAFSRAF